MTNKSKKRLVIIIACITVIVLVAILLVFLLRNKISFVTEDGKSIGNNSTIEVAHGSAELPKISALYNDKTPIDVTTTGEADLNKIGEYRIAYSASHDGNEKTISVVIKVVDKTPPEIKLKGGEELNWVLGKEFVDPGFTAIDNVDGDVSANVKVSGTVDANTEGDYTLTYTVSDSAKNEATVTRKVHVVQKKEVDPGNKVVYLTYDDGPGPYTQKLLDILDKYNVKVTFFVTNGFPNYQNLIAEEARRGHTVAVHSYTHKYEQIYTGVEAFFDDFNKMNDVIKNQTGHAASILRFPGGGSNTISKKYCPGIMTTLTNEVGNRGILYADWNVSSGDAGETTSTQQVVANVISGIQKNNVSTVLQHDIKDFSVNAVEQIIQWGQANGYTFLPLTETSPMHHHAVNN